MCCTTLNPKTFCLGIVTGILAWTGEWLHRALDRLNRTWYRFSLYCFSEIAKWPNQTTGELLPVVYVGPPVDFNALRQETWV